MDRELWTLVRWALRRLPRRRRRGERYTTAEVLAVLLWAALNDRSVDWACRRSSWPAQAWRRRLPDQSTVSRRLRRPEALAGLAMLLDLLQARLADDGSAVALADGKPLPVGPYSADAEARNGRAAAGFARGYKLHALCASATRLIGHAVEPMNAAECKAAEALVEDAARRRRFGGKALLLADSAYDTNNLHAACARAGVQLLAPRRTPGRGLAENIDHEPSRVLSRTILEGDPGLAAWQRSRRAAVEHYFAGLVSGARLYALPPWVRTLPRVRLWVAAKIALNAARLAAIQAKVA